MITVIGGGVIGLSIAWEIASRGEKIVLFEKGTIGSGASLSAAGMITPASEVHYGEEKLLQLFLKSLKLYPSFIQKLERETDLKTDFNTNGSLMIAIDQDDEAELTRLHDYQKSLGLDVDRLSSREVAQKEPLLSSHYVDALYAKEEYCVDNRLLIHALKQALQKNGGLIFENSPVQEVVFGKEKVAGVVVKNEMFKTDQIILATGVDAQLEGLPEDLNLPIRPVKGQALAVQMKGDQRLKHSIRTIHRYPVYLVPRSDGRLVIGATLEEMGMNTEVTAGALLDLIYGAWKILPLVYELPVVETWAGLRPTSRDHAPILGPTNYPGLHVAMGMYRHGILLAPVVGQLIADGVVEKKKTEFFDDFGIQRFSKC